MLKIISEEIFIKIISHLNSGDYLKKAVFILVIFLVISLPQWVEEIINTVSNLITNAVALIEKIYYVFSKLVNLLNTIEVSGTGSYNNSGKT